MVTKDSANIAPLPADVDARLDYIRKGRESGKLDYLREGSSNYGPSCSNATFNAEDSAAFFISQLVRGQKAQNADRTNTAAH